MRVIHLKPWIFLHFRVFLKNSRTQTEICSNVKIYIPSYIVYGFSWIFGYFLNFSIAIYDSPKLSITIRITLNSRLTLTLWILEHFLIDALCFAKCVYILRNTEIFQHSVLFIVLNDIRAGKLQKKKKKKRIENSGRFLTAPVNCPFDLSGIGEELVHVRDWPDRSKALRRPPTISHSNAEAVPVSLKVTGTPQGHELFAPVPIHLRTLPISATHWSS